MIRSPILIALTTLTFAIATAVAAPTPTEAVKRTFGNTIVSTYSDGRRSFLWLYADGTFKSLGRRRTTSTGLWSTKGEQICLKRLHPPAPIDFCTPAPLADTWPARTFFGDKIQVSIVKGVVDH